MNTKSIRLFCLFVVLCATVATVHAAPEASPDRSPRVIITVDYTPETPPGRRHVFYSWEDFLRYFRRVCLPARLRPNWP